jgi:dipeptidyl-peptidase 4
MKKRVTVPPSHIAMTYRAPYRIPLRFVAAISLIAVPVVVSAQTPVGTGSNPMSERYRRAEAMLTWNIQPLVIGDAVSPNWFPDGHRFWYRVTRPNGADFMIVDPVKNEQRPAFDNVRMTAALSALTGKAFDAAKPAFRTLKFVEDEKAIEVQIDSLLYTCNITTYTCKTSKPVKEDRKVLKSPDKKWEAFVHNYNLYVRPADACAGKGGSCDSIQLTNDGIRYFAYGKGEPYPSEMRGTYVAGPRAQWSPDSKRLLVTRVDERGVGLWSIISSAGQRPVLYQWPNPLPGDSAYPRPELYLVDISARQVTKIRVDSTIIDLSTSSATDSAWSHGPDTVYLATGTRGRRWSRLHMVDLRSGQTKVLAQDSSAKYVISSGLGTSTWHVSRDGGTVIWHSARDGWSHLYRYDRNGALVKQLTSGTWNVGNLLAADVSAKRIFFTAYGTPGTRDPLFPRLYSVDYDGKNLRLLTPEDAHHDVKMSPDGRFIVDTYSRVDLPAVSVLRSSVDGNVIRTLERADVSKLLAAGYRPPEPFTVKARDGVTDLYGVLYFPSDFDATKKYPVVDLIYPGPMVSNVPKSYYPSNAGWGSGSFYADQHQARALAELGFIVMQVDAIGTANRSVAFQTSWTGNMGDNGIPDHIATLRQLALRHPWLDISRVGVYGNSGGGFASTDAILRYPDVFKVAVSAAGNHDNASYGAYWGERFQGFLTRDPKSGATNYENQANRQLAKNLKGKLLLIHGDVDTNVHMITTMQVADALIKANKRFDMFIVPEGEHDIVGSPYVLQLAWDYFVKNLMGVEPPTDVVIRGAQ